MTLPEISDWLRVNLLGEVIEWVEHEWQYDQPHRYRRCSRCKLKAIPEEVEGTCKPPLPSLAADDQYWRVANAMEARGYAFRIRSAAPAKIIAYFKEYQMSNSEPRLGSTIGEAICRAAFAVLGGVNGD